MLVLAGVSTYSRLFFLQEGITVTCIGPRCMRGGSMIIVWMEEGLDLGAWDEWLVNSMLGGVVREFVKWQVNTSETTAVVS
jgi:hypothetical protein